MRRRHPHLYGAGEAEEWETLKAREREALRAKGKAVPEEGAPRSILQGLPRGLEPLSRAHRIQERVSSIGFDWADARGAFEKVAEEVEEVRHALEAEPSPALEEELGDLLFAVVNLTRLAGTHALTALQRANRKFTTRFEALEELAAEAGVVLSEASLEELDGLWDEVKRRERRT
jgi:MazG family protein